MPEINCLTVYTVLGRNNASSLIYFKRDGSLQKREPIDRPTLLRSPAQLSGLHRCPRQPRSRTSSRGWQVKYSAHFALRCWPATKL